MFLTGFGYTFIKFKLISWIESSPLLTAFGLPFSFIQFQLSGNELSKSGVINSKVFPVPSAHVGQSEICVSQRAKTFNPTRVSPYSPDASRSPFPSIISHETSEDQSPSVQTNSIISPWVASNVKLAENPSVKVASEIITWPATITSTAFPCHPSPYESNIFNVCVHDGKGFSTL